MKLKIAEVARASKGWTMRQLAERLMVDHQTVLYWNQGRCCPRLPMLVRMCQVLDCSFHDLIDL